MKVTIYIVIHGSRATAFETFKKSKSFYGRQSARIRCGDVDWSANLQRVTFEGSPRAVLTKAITYASLCNGGTTIVRGDREHDVVTMNVKFLERTIPTTESKSKKGYLV